MGIAAAIMLALHAGSVWGRPGPKLGTLQAILFATFMSTYLTWTLDPTGRARTVTISDKAISAMSNVGYSVSVATYRLNDIRAVRLRRPAETGRRFGILVLVLGKSVARIGIPAILPAERVANVLHGLGIPIELADRSPGDAMNPEATSIIEDSPALARTTAFARIERLPAGQTGQILTPRRNAIAVSM